jgi:hypothetical protein
MDKEMHLRITKKSAQKKQWSLVKQMPFPKRIPNKEDEALYIIHIFCDFCVAYTCATAGEGSPQMPEL